MKNVCVYTFSAFLATTGKDASEKIHNLYTSDSGNSDNGLNIIHAVNLENINTANLSATNRKKNNSLITSHISTADHDITPYLQDLRASSLSAKQNVHVYFYLIDTSVTKSVYTVDGNFLSVRGANTTFRADQLSLDRYFTDEQVSNSTEETRDPPFTVPVFQLPTPAGVTSSITDSFNIGRISLVIKSLAVLLCTTNGALPSGSSLYAFDADTLGTVSVAEEQAALVILIASMCKSRTNIANLCGMYRQFLIDCQHHDPTFCARLTEYNTHYKYCRSIDTICTKAEDAIWSLSRHYASSEVHMYMSIAITDIMFLMVDDDDDGGE